MPASREEEDAFETLATMTFHKLDQHRSGSLLFKTTLEKALFSSPAACLQTLDNRMTSLEKVHGSTHPDTPLLETFAGSVAGIKPATFTKFSKLVEVLTDKKNPLFWNGKDTTDRLVIFTERVETLNGEPSWGRNSRAICCSRIWLRSSRVALSPWRKTFHP